MTAWFISSSLIVLAGITALILPARVKGIVYTVLAGGAAVLASIPAIGVLMTGTQLSTYVYLGFPLGWIAFSLDPLSAFFTLVVSIGNFLVALYSVGYVRFYEGKRNCTGFYFFLALLFASMLLILGTASTLAFCVLWEIMSLSSFFLVAYEHEKKEAVDSAVYYLVAMQLGFVFILFGFMLVSIRAGSLDFAYFKNALAGDPAFASLAFVLFFVGFGTKSGFAPFHTWLPKAHPNAPTPVSAAMSGIMIKIGIYGIIRIVTMMGIPELYLSITMLILSLVTAVWGVLHAIAQHDIKRLLAYHSIENIGIIGIGIGLGMTGLSLGNQVVAFCGFAGAILHVANHFLFKSLLFFGAGAVYVRTKTRNVELLGGVAKIMPLTAVFFLTGSIAICGLPPLNGFVSELAIYLGFVKGLAGSAWFTGILFVLSFAGLALTGALALFCFTKAYGVVFSGLPRSEQHKAKSEAPFSMLVPMGILSLLIVCIGVFPNLALRLVQQTACAIAGTDAFSGAYYPLQNSFATLSGASIMLLVMLALALVLRFALLSGKRKSMYKTWDCGYQAGSPRIQYTASSFASIVQTVFSPLVRYRAEVLSDDRKHSTYNRIIQIDTRTEDITERYIVKPGIAAIETVLKFFHWMQSGNTQQYILYGILFLVILIVIVFGVKI